MKFFIVVFILFFTSSCKEEVPNFHVIYNNDVKLVQNTSNNISLDGVNIGPVDKYGLIEDIHFLDNEILMLDVKSDSIFVKYNLKKGLKKSITRGEGPNQIMLPQFIKITSFNNFSNDIQVYDFNKGLIKVNFTYQKKNSYFKLAKYDYKTTVQSIVMIQEGVFAIANLDPQTKFSIYNDKTKKTNIISPNKKLEINYTNDALQILSPSDIGFNKNNKILFTWNGNLNSIDLHNEKGNFIKSYTFGNNKNIVDKKINQDFFYYYDVKSYDDYIYGLYAGFNIVDNFTQDLIPHLRTEVHIFNIKTDEIKRYRLDRLINSCTIDFKSNIIYGIEENNESQPLVKYEMD